MDNQQILDTIMAIDAPSEGYTVFRADIGNSYFGKDSCGNPIFMMASISEKMPPLLQETRSLRFCFNQLCTFVIDGGSESRTMHLLTCKAAEEEKALAFIRLTHAFSVHETDNDQYYLTKLFSALSALFDKQRCAALQELQGLFAELYTILYFHNAGYDISAYWQSRNKMKFDFSINEKKRLEIKSTLKPSRTHHFKHDQLQSALYDIKIVSLMLQKNDRGISLGDVIERIRKLYPNQYALLLHIDSIVMNVGASELSSESYDETYIKENIRFYSAEEIPHFDEKTPEGVYNAEYDCVLDGAPTISLETIIAWMKRF